MRKWDVLLIVLLVASIGFNVFIWKEVKEIRENQVGIARRDQIEKIGTEVSEAVLTLKGFAQEQKWIKESSFVLNKDLSQGENMIVEGFFTFNRLDEDQTPFILYREQGTGLWTEKKLKLSNALSYSGQIEVSPLKQYEYQLFARGKTETASEILLIPYNLYGLPNWKTEIKTNLASNSKNVNFLISLFSAVNYPLDEMAPEDVNFILIKDGEVVERVPFSYDDKNPYEDTNTWVLEWSISDASIIDEVEAYVEVEYKNGLVKKEKLDLFQERVKYEIQKKASIIPAG